MKSEHRPQKMNAEYTENKRTQNTEHKTQNTEAITIHKTPTPESTRLQQLGVIAKRGRSGVDPR